MKIRRLIAAVCLVFVLLCTAWLVFSSVMISRTLFPGGNRILIQADEGAELKVVSGGLHVLSGSAGMTRYYTGVIPAIAVPFALLVVFALIGCVLLFRGRSPHNCSKCDYDLRGTLANVACPECGTPVAKLAANFGLQRNGTASGLRESSSASNDIVPSRLSGAVGAGR